MIGVDDLMASVGGESLAIGVAYDCELEPKPRRGPFVHVDTSAWESERQLFLS